MTENRAEKVRLTETQQEAIEEQLSKLHNQAYENLGRSLFSLLDGKNGNDLDNLKEKIVGEIRSTREQFRVLKTLKHGMWLGANFGNITVFNAGTLLGTDTDLIIMIPQEGEEVK